MKAKDYYRQKRPHVQPMGGTFFVTFHLPGCLSYEDWIQTKRAYDHRLRSLPPDSPATGLKRRQIKWEYYQAIDHILNTGIQGPSWLSHKKVADSVAETLHFWDGKKIDLYGYVIMPNHVHVLMHTYDGKHKGKATRLDIIMHSIKSYSAQVGNRILEREGKFWQHESYDRAMRNEEDLYQSLAYLLGDPVRAGLCEDRKDWPFTYVANFLWAELHIRGL